ATLHLAHEEHEDSDDHENREAGYQQLSPDALLLRLLAVNNNVVVEGKQPEQQSIWTQLLVASFPILVIIAVFMF
ncbi:hypothetical protein QCD79_32050, partial [Pseudomonas quasicaspiana]|nr:hypothetical protein [Pseudomonas quasicaspiana]